MAYMGLAYLRRKLEQKRVRVLIRYQYYELKNIARDFNISTPPDLKYVQEVLGWCAQSVDSLADRVVFRGFTEDLFDMQGIYDMNNPDILFDSSVNGALVSSCDFIYVSPDETGFPRLQVIFGGDATGEMDPITGLLTEGYAVLSRDKELGYPTLEAYFTPESTWYIPRGGSPYSKPNPAPYPLLVPIVYRPDAVRPFGHSKISRAQMALVSAALRTLKRSEIAAEFYSYPQKYVTGLSNDAEKMDSWKATLSAMLAFTKDEDGDYPHLGQFQATSMSPHIEQLKMITALFAGDTHLTMNDLGFENTNPSSSDAIKASHENLRLAARKAQRTFGSGFINAGYLAACVRDNFPYERKEVYKTKCRWYPIFEPDISAIGAAGDALNKIELAKPGYLTDEKVEDLLGI